MVVNEHVGVLTMFQHLFAINRDDDLHVVFALYVLYVLADHVDLLYVLDDHHVDGLYLRDDHHVYVKNDGLLYESHGGRVVRHYELLAEQLVGTV